MRTIGVMCYQGGGHLYVNVLKNFGFKILPIYADTDFFKTDGIVLPGGESSAQYDYCINSGLDKKIIKYSLSKKPILGTCAGAILLSKYSSERVSGFGMIEARMARNFYGRQIKSTTIKTDHNHEVVFIRAPGILKIGRKVTVFDSYEKKPIFIKQENIYCTTFHPELGKFDQNNAILKVFRDLL